MSKIISEGEVYLNRQFCKVRAIDFEDLTGIKFIRNFEDIDPSKLKSRKKLFFFTTYHQNIIAVSNNSGIPSKDGKKTIERVRIKSYARKYETNKDISRSLQQKLGKIQQKYQQYYVKPTVKHEQLMQIVKRSYVKYIRSVLQGNQPEPFPFVSQKILERTRAATTIQRFWRGGKTREKINARIRIRQEEAAITIQRWLRNLKFKHRYKFLLEVRQYIKKQQNSDEIVL